MGTKEFINQLTSEEIEAAYRYQKKQYQIQDAKNFVEEEYEDLASSFTEDMYEELAEEFEENYDCNVAENDMWRIVIDEYVKEMFLTY